jgi:hypothetical protein
MRSLVISFEVRFCHDGWHIRLSWLFQQGTSRADRLSRSRYFRSVAFRSDRDALYQKRCATKSNRGNYPALMMFQDDYASMQHR